MENSLQIRHIVAGAAAAVVIVGAIMWSLYPAQVAAPAASDTASTTPAATTTVNGITSTGAFTVAKDDTVVLPTPPDFRAPISYAATVTPEVRSIIAQRAAALEAKLTKDSFDLGSWIDLGTLRKMAGDYRGAETAWVFVTKAAPRNTIAFSNLADLYMNFLKEYPQAEAMYQKVMALDATQIEPYVSLATLYGNFYKTNTSAAEDILKKGIAAHPDSVDLHLLLARMYSKAGRASDAKTQYQAAIAAAQKQGNADLAAQLKTEAGI